MANPGKPVSRTVRPPEPDSDRTPELLAPRGASSADHLAAEIVRGLYDGRYAPGQKLLEADLTRRYGVGRSTVREAIRRLESEGFVSISLHRGARIRALGRQEARDMLEVTEALAGLSARLAAERIRGADDEAALRLVVTMLQEHPEPTSGFDFGRVRNRFYRQLARLAGNLELERLVTLVQGHLVRVQFRAAYDDELEARGLREYGQIVDAILARDGARAERAMRVHIRGVADAISRLPDEHFGV